MTRVTFVGTNANPAVQEKCPIVVQGKYIPTTFLVMKKGQTYDLTPQQFAQIPQRAIDKGIFILV